MTLKLQPQVVPHRLIGISILRKLHRVSRPEATGVFSAEWVPANAGLRAAARKP